MTMPLMIGGATTSKTHTALRIEPVYSVPLFMCSMLARCRCCGHIGQRYYAEKFVATPALNIATSAMPVGKTAAIGFARRSLRQCVEIDEARSLPRHYSRACMSMRRDLPIRAIISIGRRFSAHGNCGNYPDIQLMKLLAKVPPACLPMPTRCLIKSSAKNGSAQGRCWPGHASDGDDVVVYCEQTEAHIRLPFLRQQIAKREGKANMCLADFISRDGDWLGGFVTTGWHRHAFGAVQSQYR
jgi:5-methyltetrahydrofolate--homocysteine methyltransferase